MTGGGVPLCWSTFTPHERGCIFGAGQSRGCKPQVTSTKKMVIEQPIDLLTKFWCTFVFEARGQEVSKVSWKNTRVWDCLIDNELIMKWVQVTLITLHASSGSSRLKDAQKLTLAGKAVRRHFHCEGRWMEGSLFVPFCCVFWFCQFYSILSYSKTMSFI